MGMNKIMIGLLFGAVVGWIAGTVAEGSSACVIGESSVIGGGSTPFAFCTLPFILVFSLVGFWLGQKMEHDTPLY